MIEYTYPQTLGDTEVFNEREMLRNVEDGPSMEGGDSVRFLVLHCSATRCNREYTVEQMMRDHKMRGFRTIGYHFYVRRSGIVTKHRRLLDVGAHCKPFNRCSIGICYEGGLDENGHPADTRTPEQTAQLTALFKRLLEIFPKAKIRGHRDMPGSIPKACPCLDAGREFGWLEGLA